MGVNSLTFSHYKTMCGWSRYTIWRWKADRSSWRVNAATQSRAQNGSGRTTASTHDNATFCSFRRGSGYPIDQKMMMRFVADTLTLGRNFPAEFQAKLRLVRALDQRPCKQTIAAKNFGTKPSSFYGRRGALASCATDRRGAPDGAPFCSAVTDKRLSSAYRNNCIRRSRASVVSFSSERRPSNGSSDRSTSPSSCKSPIHRSAVVGLSLAA